MSNRTIKQYENDNGIVMFIDDRKNFKTIVSFTDITGKEINNNDDRALRFFQNNPYLVMELEENYILDIRSRVLK